ncbi:sulfurtransferase complex subunit TusD [Zymobacter sp. IVIA_12111.31 C1]|uniref:sulfurtransferase complex subunit TusD n=1 Tax=Zymobacter sp. IVIA_12111.31 C1 TaxID=3394854 RepID=UPI0039C2C86E
MDYGFMVLGAPYSTQASHSALRLAEALPERGHRLKAVFFYHDGVFNGAAAMTPPQDEPHLLQRWQRVAEKQQCELLVCVAAGARRGILDAREASRYGIAAPTLADGFRLAGLSELVMAQQLSDRFITFAP